MKLKTVLLLSAAILLVAASCKKKEEETTYLSFVGSPEFTLPPFVEVGQTISITPKAVTRASTDTETSEPGCYWTISQLAIRDTVRREGDPASQSCSFSFEVPDSLQTLTVLCSRFADGYTNSSHSVNTIVVRTGNGYSSLQGFKYPEQRFTDTRDFRSYHYLTAAGMDWMAENLAYEGCGYSYFKCAVMDKLFGRFYTWNEAKSACPEGWRLPTNEEILALTKAFTPEIAPASAKETFKNGAGRLMANGYFNASRLWEFWPDVTPVNTSGFSLLPLGYVSIQGEENNHLDVMKYAMFWTGDELDGDQAYFRSVYMKYDSISCETGYKDYMALNTRCVREHPAN